MIRRPKKGRALFYTRDSGGEHETTPGEYVGWARRSAERLGVAFGGTAEQIASLIRRGGSHEGDVFLDYGVKGNQLVRDGLTALVRAALADTEVTHVLIPRRDRLARPDDAIDGLRLEGDLRRAGLTLVFMDKELSPLERGRRHDLSEQLVAMLDYSYAGEFRRELAQKMIYAQLALARAGFSCGGRPPYGFRRWLVREDGSPARQLAEGEQVRMPGHHVAWLPGPEAEQEVVRLILARLEAGMPAARVAAQLTAEGVPSPDSGRRRTDRGVTHATSGVWHQTTVVNIARNPLVAATMAYGRRSMGDQLRFTPQGPRPLEDGDFRPDTRPKVVANPREVLVTAPARFEPLLDAERHRRLLDELDARGGTQRGKPRSRDPRRNPLGGRVFDMGCGWPMYRQPYDGSFRYLCGLYQQSHGARCQHNHVPGPAAARFLLGTIRQSVTAPSVLAQLRERLLRLAEAEQCGGPSRHDPAAKRASLAELERKLEKAGENMALAEDEAQLRSMQAVFDRLRRQRDALVEEVRSAPDPGPAADPNAEVAAAVEVLGRLGELASDPENLESIGELFRSLDVRLFLRFQEAPWGKRTVNRVAGGVVTFGTSPPPVPLYEGPTSRRQVKNSMPPPLGKGFGIESHPGIIVSGLEGDSSGNVNRGERI